MENDQYEITIDQILNAAQLHVDWIGETHEVYVTEGWTWVCVTCEPHLMEA